MAEPQNCSQLVHELHQLYCQLTGQNVTLRFDRERLWYEFLQAGFNAADLRQVITYLQKEIRTARRNIGAPKLSNLLQRFLDCWRAESLPSRRANFRYPLQLAALFPLVVPRSLAMPLPSPVPKIRPVG